MKPRSETSFLFTSLGKKYLMGLTGAYFAFFLVVHLAGNLTMLDTTGKLFNLYAHTMASNLLIQYAISPLGFLLILVHIVDGVLLTKGNKQARPVQYAVSGASANSSFQARFMAPAGLLIFAFLVLHLSTFWYRYKFNVDSVPLTMVDGVVLRNKYVAAREAFSQLWYVVLYVVAMAAIASHTRHGFYSMFQSLGLNHPKYTPIIKKAAIGYSILIPALFALIPVYMYLKAA